MKHRKQKPSSRGRRPHLMFESDVRRKSTHVWRSRSFLKKYRTVDVHADRPKWYKTRFKNPDRGKDPLALFDMFAKMFRLWFYQNIIYTVTRRSFRRGLFILTTISMVVGMISLAIGVAHIRRRKNILDPNPYNPVARSHYIGITIMGIVLILSSIFGFLGIYKKSRNYTKVFALLSFIYGYLLITVYLSWITQIYFVKMQFYNRTVKHNLIVRGKQIIKEIIGEGHSHEYDAYIYDLTFFFMNLIIVAAILQLSSGVISLGLLVMHTEKQGYIPLYKRAE